MSFFKRNVLHDFILQIKIYWFFMCFLAINFTKPGMNAWRN